jgi:NADH:ubiquinone oxidoreductase subunit K
MLYFFALSDGCWFLIFALPSLISLVQLARIRESTWFHKILLLACILLLLQHVVLIVHGFRHFDPNTASHIGAIMYPVAAMMETILVLGIWWGLFRVAQTEGWVRS